MSDHKKPRHKHFWYYPHQVINGRVKNEIAVVRYCDCGLRQVAFTSNWRKAAGDYALEEHYK